MIGVTSTAGQWRRFIRNENGSTLPLTIFYTALALAVVLLVLSASSLYLERKRLFTVADGAALVGAESFGLDQVQLDPDSGTLGVRLESAEVDAAVRGYLRDIESARFEELRVERAKTSDGRTATVTLSARWRPVLIEMLAAGGIRIEVTSTARSVLW